MPTTNQDELDLALGYFRESLPANAKFVQQFNDRYTAYRGWTHDLEQQAHHPPFIMRAVETSLASLIDDDLRFTFTQRMMLLDPQEQKAAVLGIKAHQSLSDWQVRASCLSDEQRDFNLQHAIAGITGCKTNWVTRRETRRRMVPHEEPIPDPLTGQPLIGMDGQPVTHTSYDTVVGETIVYDGPETRTIDMRDFGWHEAATSIRDARYVWHRVPMDREAIKDRIDSGEFGPKRGGWAKDEILKYLKDAGQGGADTARERATHGGNRWKDKIAVVELWDRVKKVVTTFTTDGVLLAYLDKFPFWHNDAPFTICSAQPDLFQVAGISQVEKIQQLQTMLWKLSTQRLLNVELLNNVISIFGAGEDPDDFPFGPGEQWFMEDPAAYNQVQHNALPAEVSVSAENSLKGDLQDLSLSSPFAAGASGSTVDNKTATGASIISGLAQRSIDMAKNEVYKAWRDVARQRGVLNQQFISAPTLVPVTGLDGKAEEPFLILPEMLGHDFDVDVEPEPSQMRKQEEQASAQALLQIAAQIAPIVAAMAQGGMGRMIRLDLLYANLLEKAGIQDAEKYFASQPPPAPVAALGQGGGGQPAQNGNGAGPPTDLNLGVTSSQAADALSPSHAESLSGLGNEQRAAAMAGPTQ